jgi:hypothetical protein
MATQHGGALSRNLETTITAHKRLVVPRVHLNGSAAEHLSDDYQHAYGALRDALTAVQATAPSERDYYVQEDGAYAQARREHEERVQRLVAVQAELIALFVAVEEQVLDQRKGRS